MGLFQKSVEATYLSELYSDLIDNNIGQLVYELYSLMEEAG